LKGHHYFYFKSRIASNRHAIAYTDPLISSKLLIFFVKKKGGGGYERIYSTLAVLEQIINRA
jgi:hypothetical protein